MELSVSNSASGRAYTDTESRVNCSFCGALSLAQTPTVANRPLRPRRVKTAAIWFRFDTVLSGRHLLFRHGPLPNDVSVNRSFRALNSLARFISFLTASSCAFHAHRHEVCSKKKKIMKRRQQSGKLAKWFLHNLNLKQ